MQAGLRVYALDFLGSGYTDRLEPCSPEACQDDIVDFFYNLFLYKKNLRHFQEAAALSGERRRNLSVAHAELLRGGGGRLEAMTHVPCLVTFHVYKGRREVVSAAWLSRFDGICSIHRILAAIL